MSRRPSACRFRPRLICMKIFGIGLSKTGTTSLTAALCTLGFRAEHSGLRFLTEQAESLHDLDAATDELAMAFGELDRKFPGSKFVLSTRDLESWLKSCEHHFRAPLDPGTRIGQMIESLYGTTVFDREKFAAGFLRHQQAVRAYFAGRPDDLLVLDVAAGDGFDKLCPFLNRPMPADSSPKENVSRSWGRMCRTLRRMLGVPANTKAAP